MTEPGEFYSLEKKVCLLCVSNREEVREQSESRTSLICETRAPKKKKQLNESIFTKRWERVLPHRTEGIIVVLEDLKFNLLCEIP